MSNAITVENFFQKVVIRDIKNNILHDKYLTWHYLYNTSYNHEISRQYRANDSNIFTEGNGTITQVLINGSNTSKILNLFPDLKKLIETKFSVKVEKIITARINYVFPVGKVSTKYDTPHVDMIPRDNEKIKTIICYMSDSDGDTVLFDEVEFDESNMENPTKKNLIERFSPKEGKAIMFDSNRYHAMSFPSKNIRMVLAIILMIDDTPTVEII
jgi:hypothetical protein